jgi:2-aminoethylphosphonate-pyruvate transaminase
MRYILLNPGPVSISDGVRKAAVATDLCHREPEYLALQDRVRSSLTGVYPCHPDGWTSVLLGGSGTTALEAMISSLVPRGARLLVVENGVYGERISRIAEIHSMDFTSIHHEWADAVDFHGVEEALTGGKFTHVAAVQHETTTGRLNDVSRLAGLCEHHGVRLLLDTVSSFGAEDIPFDSPALEACAAAAGKCLHGIPGLSFVVCRKPALSRSVEPPRSLYLHLPLWAGAQDRQGTPFTPPVNSLLALEKALEELADGGGWKARHAQYTNLASQVRRALSRHGVVPLLGPGESSCVLNAYRLPADKTYADIHDGLKQRGFIIYAGEGGLASEMFRISTMGDISHYDMERLLAALSAVFSN